MRWIKARFVGEEVASWLTASKRWVRQRVRGWLKRQSGPKLKRVQKAVECPARWGNVGSLARFRGKVYARVRDLGRW